MQDIQEKQQKGLIPILQKAEEAINEVANSKELLYILDASAGKGLLVSKGEVIYDALKVKLGLLPDQKRQAPPATQN